MQVTAFSAWDYTHNIFSMAFLGPLKYQAIAMQVQSTSFNVKHNDKS